jgi:hypothetical protein
MSQLLLAATLKSKGSRYPKKKAQKKKQKGSQKLVVTTSRAPANVSYNVRPRQAHTRTIRDGIELANSEMVISSIAGNQDYSWSINPGIAQLLMWGNQIAGKYESYRFKKLIFTFLPASINEPGKVMMVIDYDAKDQAPTITQAAQMAGPARDGAWKKINMRFSPSRAAIGTKWRYVRSAGTYPSGDPDLYDAGNLYFFSTGTTSATIGELWVEYVVELKLPNVGTNTSPALGSAYFSEVTTPYTPAGATQVVDINNPPSLNQANISNDSAYQLSFNSPGEYQIEMNCKQTVTDADDVGEYDLTTGILLNGVQCAAHTYANSGGLSAGFDINAMQFATCMVKAAVGDTISGFLKSSWDWLTSSSDASSGYLKVVSQGTSVQTGLSAPTPFDYFIRYGIFYSNGEMYFVPDVADRKALRPLHIKHRSFPLSEVKALDIKFNLHNYVDKSRRKSKCAATQNGPSRLRFAAGDVQLTASDEDDTPAIDIPGPGRLLRAGSSCERASCPLVHEHRPGCRDKSCQSLCASKELATSH